MLVFFFSCISFINYCVIKRSLAFPVSRGFNTMDHVGTVDAEDDPGTLPRLAPSPHSEAVAHEFKELSLQPSQYLPPLNERKNGECKRRCPPFALLFSVGIVIFVCFLQITPTVFTCLSHTTFCGVKVPLCLLVMEFVQIGFTRHGK